MGTIVYRPSLLGAILALCIIGFAYSQTTTAKAADHVPSGMVQLSGGTFTMGSENRIDWQASPSHKTTVSPFLIDKCPVTQAQYASVMKVNPSHFTGEGSMPVEEVTWFDAVLYCNARSKIDKKDTVYSYSGLIPLGGNACGGLINLKADFSKDGYRLPTEAEWEYACRAGTATPFYWGDDSLQAGKYCWDNENSNHTSHPVGHKLPNAWGLYDMCGNVWEWCNDWYGGAYDSTAQSNPTGPVKGSYRMLRGGSWYFSRSVMRSAVRLELVPDYRFVYIGFRCVCR